MRPYAEWAAEAPAMLRAQGIDDAATSRRLDDMLASAHGLPATVELDQMLIPGDPRLRALGLAVTTVFVRHPDGEPVDVIAEALAREVGATMAMPGMLAWVTSSALERADGTVVIEQQRFLTPVPTSDRKEALLVECTFVRTGLPDREREALRTFWQHMMRTLDWPVLAAA